MPLALRQPVAEEGDRQLAPRRCGQKILGYQRRSESQLLDTHSCYILLNTIEFCSLLGVLVPSAGALGEKPDALATVNFRELHFHALRCKSVKGGQTG